MKIVREGFARHAHGPGVNRFDLRVDISPRLKTLTFALKLIRERTVKFLDFRGPVCVGLEFRGFAHQASTLQPRPWRDRSSYRVERRVIP